MKCNKKITLSIGYAIPVFVVRHYSIMYVSDIYEKCCQRCRYNQHQMDAGDN